MVVRVAALAVLLMILFASGCGGARDHARIPPPPPPPPPATAAEPPPAAGRDDPAENGMPWPPPAASATEVLPRNMVPASVRSMADADALLTSALRANGYTERGYCSVPRGFAIVTRLERMLPDGRSFTMPARWAVDSSGIRTMSLREYLRALFTADPGFYRIIVFVVTPEPFQQTEAKVTAAEVKGWLSRGWNVLPPHVGALPFDNGTNITALVYEFEKSGDAKVEARVRVPGALDGHSHLRESGLWASLGLR